jgi:hypothetical protein
MFRVSFKARVAAEEERVTVTGYKSTVVYYRSGLARRDTRTPKEAKVWYQSMRLEASATAPRPVEERRQAHRHA